MIDEDYNNKTLKCKLYNNGLEPFKINIGDKICQGVLHLVPKVFDVDILDKSRDGKGFGSSDKKG